MDSNSGKSISLIPWIMMVFALYVGYKAFFADNKPHKIYHIAAPAHDSLGHRPDTTQRPIKNEWSVPTHSKQPLVTKDLPYTRPAFTYKPLIAYYPKVAPPEEVVKNLLEQGETPKEISRQTRLTKKEIRKIKRQKKAEERKDRKQRRKALLVKKELTAK